MTANQVISDGLTYIGLALTFIQSQPLLMAPVTIAIGAMLVGGVRRIIAR